MVHHSRGKTTDLADEPGPPDGTTRLQRWSHAFSVDQCTRLSSEARSGRTQLRGAALVNGITFLDPIYIEARRQDQHSQPREPRVLQGAERGPQIGALLERAAAAVQHYIGTFRKR